MKLSDVPATIDLVDFGELRLFMFREDNLYRIGVPEERRGFPILRHYDEVRATGYPRSPVTLETARTSDDSRFAFQGLISHLHRHGIPVHLLDVGAFIGDFALLLASFARTNSIAFKAECFDPSPAGALIPFNIEINGLEEYVTFHDLAVSQVDGPLKFSHRLGHLDSGSVASPGEQRDVDYLVRSTRLSTFMRRRDIPPRGLMVKIDTEGLEPLIVQDLLSAVSEPPIVVFEFTPRTFVENRIDCFGYMRELAKYYHLFDVSHLPHPSRVRPIHPDQQVPFIDMVCQRRSGYADILLLPHQLPGYSDLEKQLARTEHGQRGLYNLVGSARMGTE